MKNTITYLVLVLATILTFSSCTKDESTDCYFETEQIKAEYSDRLESLLPNKEDRQKAMTCLDNCFEWSSFMEVYNERQEKIKALNCN